MTDGAEPSNVTIVLPVRTGSEQALDGVLQQMQGSEEQPFERVASTHFARFVVFDTLDGNGEPAGPPGSYLLLGADFDGPRARWVDALAATIGDAIDEVLSHCEGYPGSAEPRRFRDYLCSHDVGAGFSVISYAATVARIRRALTLQRGLRELADRARSLTDDELRSEWTRRFAETP